MATTSASIGLVQQQLWMREEMNAKLMLLILCTRESKSHRTQLELRQT